MFVLPQAKQSTRLGHGHGYTDKKKELYVWQLRGMAKQRPPERLLTGPLSLTVVFVFPFLKSDLKGSKKRPDNEWWYLVDVRPDTSNLLKPFEDALNGVVASDDGKYSTHRLAKVRRRDSEGAIVVQVKEWEERKPLWVEKIILTS